jgi:hypothetical protein
MAEYYFYYYLNPMKMKKHRLINLSYLNLQNKPRNS